MLMAAIRPAAAAGSAAAAVAGVLLAVLLAAAALCTVPSSATVDEAELIVSTGSMMGTSVVVPRVQVPAMYVFGDSLVDAGNNDFLPAPAPKAAPPNGVDLPSTVLRRTGRFTNAYNLADIIAQHVGFRQSPPAYLSLTPSSWLDLLRGRVGTNYASGGSGILDVTVSQHVGFRESPPAYLSLTPLSSRQLDLLRGRVGSNYASAGSGILDATGNGTISLREQVELFGKTKATILRAGLVGRESLDDLLGRSLFVISAGGNDLSTFVDSGLPMSRAPEFMAAMVADYLRYINALYKLGGARRLLLVGIAPVGCLPSQRATTADGECDGDQNYLSELFNSLLRAEMAKVVAAGSMPALSYSFGNLYNVLSDLIADPTLAGLREVKTACCGSGKFNGEVDCSVDTELCVDRDEYAFWNMVHGTQAAYRWAFLAIFYGTMREAEPINLQQLLLQEKYSM